MTGLSVASGHGIDRDAGHDVSNDVSRDVGLDGGRGMDRKAMDVARVQTGPQHQSYIDALRGVAVLAVVVCHAVTCTSGLSDVVQDFGSRCSSGVQLFYALSAFTLCESMRVRGTDRAAVANYAWRRVFRIVPMFWFAIVFFIFVDMYATHWGPTHGFQNGGLMLLAAALLHGFNVYAINSVVPGGWSVAVEAQFYVLLPLIFWYATTLRRTFALLGVSVLISIAYMPLMEGLLAPFYGAGEREIVHEFVYFSLPTQLPIFMMGLVAFRLLGPDRAILARIEAKVPLRPIAIALAVLTMLPLRHSFPGHHGYGVMSLALIYACATARFRPLDNRFTRYFGKISYSAYLLHFAVLFFIETYGGAWLGTTPSMRLATMIAVAVAVLAGLATVTYTLIEQPGIALGREVTRRILRSKPNEAAALQMA